jgi:hypothetical protein
LEGAGVQVLADSLDPVAFQKFIDKDSKYQTNFFGKPFDCHPEDSFPPLLVGESRFLFGLFHNF